MAKSSSSKKNNFLMQGSILAIAGIIVRLIGLLYKVPLTNIIGEDGMGVYSTAFSIYNILLLISSYSLPLAVSRLIAARLAVKEYKNSRQIFMGACLFAVISGGIFGSITFFGSDLLASVMKMPEASLAIKTLAPTIFIVAVLGVLRGYFQGHGTMIPTALSQIFEQVVNAAVSLIAGYQLFKLGASKDAAGSNFLASSYGAAGGTIGTGAGALTALLFCLFIYFAYRPSILERCYRDRSRNEEKFGFAMKVIIMTILPVLISSTIYQISTVVDQSIFAQYIGGDYKSIWGAYSSKYTLLIHVPTAIASALGSSVIPTLAAAIQRGTRTEIIAKASVAVRFNMLIAIPATIGLAVLASPVMSLLFRGDSSLAVTMMVIGSSAVLFTSLSTITNSILQGIGNIWIPVKNALISLIVHVGVLALFLWVFDLGVYGVVMANIFFYILMCMLNNLSLRTILQYRQEIVKTFLLPLAASAVMGVAAYFVNSLMMKATGSVKISVLAAVIIAVVVYLLMLIVTRAVDEVDLRRVPGGRRIVKLCRRLHLLR